MSTLSVNTIINTDGVQQYLAKAWVNFNGTGTVAIRASGNVSSITDNGAGDYTASLTNNLADSNYSAFAGGIGFSLTNMSSGLGVIAGASSVASLKSTSQLRVQIGSGSNGVPADNAEVNISIFR